MSARPSPRRVPAPRPTIAAMQSRRVARSRPAALDPAGLILELEMVALVRRIEGSLRQSRERAPSYWRRLIGWLREL